MQQQIEPGAVGGGEEEVAAGDVEVQDWTDKIYSHDENYRNDRLQAYKRGKERVEECG